MPWLTVAPPLPAVAGVRGFWMTEPKEEKAEGVRMDAVMAVEVEGVGRLANGMLSVGDGLDE